MTFTLMLTFVTTTVLSARLMVIFFRWFGMNVGNSGGKSIADSLRTLDGVIAMLFMCGVVAPILEEYLCRALPMKFSTGTTMMLVSSFIFALLHGIKNDKGEIVLPIPQFFLGLVFWHVALTYGLNQAIILHSLHNVVCVDGSFCSQSHPST